MTQTVNQNAAIPANSPDASTVIGAALNAKQTEKDTASGAIAIKNGKVWLSAGSALAMTLALPTAGTDDFKELEIVSDSAQAHTVTTPSNGINGNKHIATFAALGDSISLVALGGVWYRLNTTTTLS
jgi:hypothetical protein